MSEPIIFNDAFLAMGTQCEVVLLDVSEDKARNIFAKVKAEVDKLEERLNRFLPESTINKLTQSPVNEWFSVERELWELLCVCHDFYQISNGAFDITVAPLVALYEEKENPSADEIAEMKLLCGFDKVAFDFAAQKMCLLQPGIEFDFGAIEKGFALDVLKPMLEEWGIKNAIVSFGEDDVLALGNHPNGSAWPIGIRNQGQPMEFVHVFAAENQVINSFGEAEKPGVSEEAAKTYTISPESGLAVKEPLTVSVKSGSGLIGSFLATCWLVLNENDRAILSENFVGVEVFEATYLENDIQTKLSIVNDKE